MDKKAMSLVTLVITVVVMIILASVIIINLENSDVIQKAGAVVDDMNLKNMQQIANMAYANVYFDNLSDGKRKEITAEEIRNRMIKDGTEEEVLNNYIIEVKNGDVFVTLKTK